MNTVECSLLLVTPYTLPPCLHPLPCIFQVVQGEVGEEEEGVILTELQVVNDGGSSEFVWLVVVV